MIRKIIDGIIKAIRTEYDTSFRIYTESVEQGLKNPCFSIMCLEPSREQKFGRRYDATATYIITYIPSEGNEPVAECNEVCENLFDLLEVISVDGSNIRGSRMDGRITDDVLQFKVNYSPLLLRTENDESMEQVEININGEE